MGIYRSIVFFELFRLIFHWDKRYFCIAIARLPKVFKCAEGSTIMIRYYKGKLSTHVDFEWRKN